MQDKQLTQYNIFQFFIL